MNTDSRASWGTNTGDSVFFVMYDRLAREFQKQLKGATQVFVCFHNQASAHTFGQKLINLYVFWDYLFKIRTR